jgi:hypothetical protein
MVLRASDFDKSPYFRAEDLQTEKKFRIKEVTAEEVGEKKEQKAVVWFKNDKRGLVLNKTNNRAIRGAFGDDMDGWKEKIIIVVPTMTDFRGKLVPALRVRIPSPKQATAGNGQAVTAAPPPSQPVQVAQPAQAPQPPAQELDEFGQPQSPEKPSLSDDLDDEITF